MKRIIIKEYSDTLKKYMKKFGLESIDIAYLAKTAKKSIDSLLNLDGSIVIETEEDISQIFGLRRFEFANPEHPMPSLDALPLKTKQRIAKRKKEGPHQEVTYNSVEINSKIIVILSSYSINDEFLATVIDTKVKEAFDEEFGNTVILGRFNSSLKGYVFKTTRQDLSQKVAGPKPVYFRLIKEVSPEVLKEAKDKIAKAKVKAEKQAAADRE